TIFYNCNFTYGYLSLVTGVMLTPEEELLLARFTRVFEQTYSRFLDLQKAETQAREARVEAALEKVRSRTMGMQHSDELREVIQTVTEQLLSLGFIFDSANFATQFDTKGFYVWNAAPGAPLLTEVYVPYTNHKFINWLFENRKKETAFESFWCDKKEKNSFFKYYFSETDAKQAAEDVKKRIHDGKAMAVSTAFRKDFALSIFNYQGKVFSEDENDIIRRFANVFEQSYTRFLDLQKAEAQARESQIQLALERVRARTMAMYKSDELKEVIQLILEQFVHLGLEIEAAGFMMDYKGSNDINVWVSSPGHPLATQIHIPYFDHPIFKLFVEAKEKGFDFYTVKLTKEEKDTFITHIFQQLPGFPEEWKQQMYAAPGYADSHVMLNNIALYIQNYTGIPYSDADNAILMRFGKAFEQTYT
ncbi:MAG: hypothetical protein ACRDE5_12075, partial [Ginsengibacter sp.]